MQEEEKNPFVTSFELIAGGTFSQLSIEPIHCLLHRTATTPSANDVLTTAITIRLFFCNEWASSSDLASEIRACDHLGVIYRVPRRLLDLVDSVNDGALILVRCAS